jgi:hypothetical protein
MAVSLNGMNEKVAIKEIQEGLPQHVAYLLSRYWPEHRFFANVQSHFSPDYHGWKIHVTMDDWPLGETILFDCSRTDRYEYEQLIVNLAQKFANKVAEELA